MSGESNTAWTIPRGADSGVVLRPSLLSVGRSAPLNDGRAETLEDVLVRHNRAPAVPRGPIARNQRF